MRPQSSWEPTVFPFAKSTLKRLLTIASHQAHFSKKCISLVASLQDPYSRW